MRYGNKLTEGHHADATISADDRTAPVRSPPRRQLSGDDDRLACRHEPGRRGGQIDDHTLPSRSRHQNSRGGMDQREQGEKGRPLPSWCISRRSSRLRRSGVGNHLPSRTGDRPPAALPEESTTVIVRLGLPQPAWPHRMSRSRSASPGHRPRWQVCDGLLFYFEDGDASRPTRLDIRSLCAPLSQRDQDSLVHSRTEIQHGMGRQGDPKVPPRHSVVTNLS